MQQLNEVDVAALNFKHSIGMNTPDLSAQRRLQKGRMPQIKILELKANSMQCAITDTDVSVVNALRRIIYAEVPTMAMDTVEIISNSSCLTDEFIAHRLGLVPLTSNTVDHFLNFRECNCNDKSTVCPTCSVELDLNVACPPDRESISVTQDDINSKSPYVRPVTMDNEDPILLLKLGTNQEIKMKMIARKGFGKEHAKYCPVSVCAYQFEPEIRLNDAVAATLSDEQKDKFVKSCPRQVYNVDPDSNQLKIVEPLNCIYCMECVREAKDNFVPNLAFVGVKPGRFIFSFETIGQLKPEQVLLAALKVLRGKLEMMETNLVEIETELVTQQPYGSEVEGAYQM